MTWVFLFYFISSLTNYILIAKNQQKKIIYINAFIALFNLIGNILVIPHYSFIGCAITTILSQMILVAISLYFIKNELSVANALFKMLYFLLAALLAVSLAVFLKNFLAFEKTIFILFTSGALFGIVYLLAWFFLKKFQKFGK